MQFYSKCNLPVQEPFEAPVNRFMPKLGTTKVDGVDAVVPVGVVDVFAIVQESKMSVDIYHLLDRYTNGDMNALNARKPVYADMTNAPETIHEAYKTMLQSRRFFDNLDPEVKAYYGNDLMVFLSRFESDLANVPKSNPIVENEVNDNE